MVERCIVLGLQSHTASTASPGSRGGTLGRREGGKYEAASRELRDSHGPETGLPPNRHRTHLLGGGYPHCSPTQLAGRRGGVDAPENETTSPRMSRMMGRISMKHVLRMAEICSAPSSLRDSSSVACVKPAGADSDGVVRAGVARCFPRS